MERAAISVASLILKWDKERAGLEAKMALIRWFLCMTTMITQGQMNFMQSRVNLKLAREKLEYGGLGYSPVVQPMLMLLWRFELTSARDELPIGMTWMTGEWTADAEL